MMGRWRKEDTKNRNACCPKLDELNNKRNKNVVKSLLLGYTFIILQVAIPFFCFLDWNNSFFTVL